jgi:hypothetical protein
MRSGRDLLDEQVLRQLLDRAAEGIDPLSATDLSRAAHAASATDDREHVLQLAGRGGSARRPTRSARWALALAATLVLALLGGIGVGRQLAPAAESAEPPVLPPAAPTFSAAGGWSVVTEEIDVPAGTHGALAANVPIESRGAPLDLAPGDLIAALPEDGILLSVAARAATPAAGREAHAAGALRLDEAEATTRWEGEAGRERPLAEYALSGRKDVLDLDVRVYFGAAEPSAAQLAAAQAQLDRLTVRQLASHVTISARPTLLRWGEPVALSGAISAPRAGERVMIEARECGTNHWRLQEIATTTAGGQWFHETTVGINGVLRARWGDATSRPVSFTVRPGVVLNMLGSPRTRVSVTSLRSFWGRQVVLQRYAPQSQRWIDVSRVRITESAGAGGYVWNQAYFRAQMTRGTLYRAVMSSEQTGPCYLAGFSNMARR